MPNRQRDMQPTKLCWWLTLNPSLHPLRAPFDVLWIHHDVGAAVVRARMRSLQLTTPALDPSTTCSAKLAYVSKLVLLLTLRSPTLSLR
jgi:hypothetical protein